MATQGIELPVLLLIKNLQEIANLMKLFANKNILADSLGGKKVDSELAKILSRLEQISAKSKTAFTTQSNFTSVQKDIGLVELSLNKVHDTIKNLGFDELKIPSEFSGQIAALLGRIRELNGSLAAFKGTLKEKLISNVNFMADLLAADPKSAAKWLEKGYDELLKAIDEGMTRVNTTLALKTAEFENQLKVITLNTTGKTSMTQWGALLFIQDAFKTLPNDNRLRNDALTWISKFMKESEDGREFSGFSKGAQGMNGFLKSIKEKFSFTDELMAEMRARIKQLVQALRDAGEKEATAATVVKSMGRNEGLAKQILFGDGANNIELSAKKYATLIRDAERMLQEKVQLENRSEAFGRVKVAFDIPNEEIKLKAAEIATALKVPEEALKGFEDSILSAATKSPELAAMFLKATGEIAALTNTVELGKLKLQSIDNTINKMLGISNFINRYVGLYAIVRKVTTAVRNAFNNIKELDKAITSIAVVTNMSQLDLWGKIGEYTAMAQQYGVATKDVYTVSQIFYQQGLQTTLVMLMTTESLKMAKIAGIDYTTAANAMTVAVRAFKMEMSEAQQVTDTYSALAAKFAVSSSEIANAMEKTASSAASVGMSLQSTSAFISVMEQTTRESAQNIGSALKSIISRYGEMKASPDKLLNIEGEDVAFNKVDTALKSIGISIKDASGLFRDFDDVIMELASKWDSLDNNTQRYIATIMAGNRQQSRFIALVSNYDELSRAMNVANNAENASIVLVAKTMDSLESKANLLKNAFSLIYLDLHAEEGLKNIYDWLTRILKTIGKLGVLKGVLPALANVIGIGTGIKGLTNIGKEHLIASKDKILLTIDLKSEEALLKAKDLLTELEKPAEKPVDLNTLAAKEKLQELNTLINNPTQIENTEENGDKVTDEADLLSHIAAVESDTSAVVGHTVIELDATSSLGNLETATEIATTALLNTETAITPLNNALAVGMPALTATNNALSLLPSNVSLAGDTFGLTTTSMNASMMNMLPPLSLAGALFSAINDTVQGLDAPFNNLNGVILLLALNGNTTNTAILALSRSADNAANKLERVALAPIRAEVTYDKNGNPIGNTDTSIPSPTEEKQGHWWNKKGYSFTLNKWGSGYGRAVAGTAASVARLAGTAIAMAGAAHLDKSTDTIETSKLLTGVGNGLSMAGTGASMGMAFGPWGATIGAIGGFVLGGIGAIIDGAKMDLSEKIALLREEAQKAQDESLKAQAKATDISSLIDNLKLLLKAMYNSTEDMLNYKDAVLNMADQYPELITAYDSAGDAIIEISNAEEELSKARLAGASAAREAAIKLLEVAKSLLQSLDLNKYSGFSSDLSSIKLYTETIASANTTLQVLSLLSNSEDILMSNLGSEYGGVIRNSLPNFDLVNAVPTSGGIMNLVDSLKAWYNKNKESLDLTQDFNDIAKHTEGSLWTVELLNNIVKFFDALTKKALLRVANLNLVANSAVGYETFLSSLDLDTSLLQEKLNQLEISKNFLGLFNAALQSKLDTTLFANLYDWLNAENSNFSEISKDVYDSFILWYNNLGDNLQKEFVNLDFTLYANVKELIEHFNIKDLNLIDSFTELFIKANLANRDRILKTIYATDENGNHTWDMNKSLTGLKKFDEERVTDTGETVVLNKAMDIAYRFANSKIASQYSDYFTTLLLEADQLALEGYAELASTRLDALNDMSKALTEMSYKDSQALFSTITNINFSSYDSIKNSITAIEAYAKTNNLDISNGPLASLLQTLTNASDNLLYNVNTLALELTTLITAAAKEIDSIINTAKSGLAFDKAIEEFNKLSSSFTNVKSFDLVFTYDTIADKYVYTVDGLNKAILQLEKDLLTRVAQLTETAKIYSEKITMKDEKGNVIINRSDRFYTMLEDSFKDADTLYTAMYASSIVLDSDSDKVKNAYLSLAAGYIQTTTEADRSWEGFLDYIKKQAEISEEARNAALVLEQEYTANKVHQYYSAIDWSKLALGTDYTKTNAELTKLLAKELGLYVEKIDEVTGEVVNSYWATKDSKAASWEEILDLYLEHTYGDNENAKVAARAAIIGLLLQAKSTQISTAINELLSGTGTILSETTIGLLLAEKNLDYKQVDGVLTSAGDFVRTSLELYNRHKDNLLTVIEKNAAYTAILNKQFEQANGVISALSSGASLDIDTLSSIFNMNGLILSDYYDSITNTWKNELSGALKTDQFGKTLITDWRKFFTNVFAQDNLDLYNTFEYQNAYSSYVDGIITLDTQMKDLITKNYNNAFSSITGWKPINVALLAANTKLRDALAQGNAIDIDKWNQGQLVITDTVEYARNVSDLMASLSTFSAEDLYNVMGWTTEDLAKNWKNAQTVLTEVKNTWFSLIDNISNISVDNISTLVEKGQFNLNDLNSEVFTKIGDTYALSLAAYSTYLVDSIRGKGSERELTDNETKLIAEAYAKAENAIVEKINGLNWTKIFDGTATLTESADFINTLQSSLASLGIAIDDVFTNNVLDVTKLKRQLSSGAVKDPQLVKSIINNIDSTIAAVRDSAIEEINSGMSLVTQGTTSLAEILKFTQRYNELVGSASENDLFEYDELLQSYTLTTKAIIQYTEKLKAVLASLGMSQEAIEQYLKNLANLLVGIEMDITGFLSGNTLAPDSKAAQALISLITQWYNLLGMYIDDYVVNNIMQQLIHGGDDAVKLLKKFKGETNVSSDEIQTVYRALMDRLQVAADQLPELIVNQIITGDLVDILDGLEGFKVHKIGDGTAVVTAVGNMIDAYSNIYKQMKVTAEATTIELNSAFAKLLTAKDQANIDAISSMGDAMGMDYETLGNLLAQYGKDGFESLEYAMLHSVELGLESLGDGTVRIYDFTTFAKKMGWGSDTEAYTSAFKAYNDSLIELNRRTEANILEEVKSLANIKAGDLINLTTLWTKIEEGIQLKIAAINPKQLLWLISALKNEIASGYKKLLESYGALFENGILTIGAEADISGIIGSIAELAAENADLLPNELAELADTVAEYIQNITSLILGGIKGSLKNVEALLLLAWANVQGLEKLDFVLTQEGLKLSQLAAIGLYTKLKEIDSILANLVFDELNESLKETNENYKSISGLTSYIEGLKKKIAELKESRGSLNEIDLAKTDAKILLYEEELALAEEIKAVRSTTEDDSFNFMSNKIPAALNNPLNYAENWGKAFKTIKEAFKTKKKGLTGFMDYQDWYNIVTEMNNIAALGGPIELAGQKLDGSLEAAAKLIEQGAAALTSVDAGDFKVDLSKIGEGIKSGADMMNADVMSGIKAMANSQVEMLDGLIAMLELIVAMELLGDIDVDGNGIEWEELFEFNEQGAVKDFSSGYSNFVEYVKTEIANGNKDLENAVKGMKIQGISLEEILGYSPQDLYAKGELFGKAYSAMLNALHEAALSGNYDLDNIADSLAQVLKESGLTETLTMDVGNTTIQFTGGTITTINWASAETSKILDTLSKQYNGDKDKAREELSNWIASYGENILEDETLLTYVLAVKKKLTINDDGTMNFNINGKSYKNINSELAGAYLCATTLEDWGVKVPLNFVGEYDEDTGKLTGTYHLGNTDIKVVAGKDGKIEWYSKDGSGPYNSLDDMLNKEFDKYMKEYAKDSSNKKLYKSQEEFNWGEYGVRGKVKYNITLDGEEVDVTNDPHARDSIHNKINEITDETLMALNKEGNLDITLDNGMKIQLDGDLVIDKNGNVDPAKVLAELKKMLGLDAGLVENITTALNEAFSGEAVKTGISEAIGTGIKNAAEDGVPVDNLKLKPEAISVDTTTVAPTAENKTAEIEVPIDSLKLLPKQLNVELTDANAEASKTSEELIVPVDSLKLLPTNLSVDTTNVIATIGSTDVNTAESIPIDEITLAPASVKLQLAEGTGTTLAQLIQEAILNSLDGLGPLKVKITPEAELERKDNTLNAAFANVFSTLATVITLIATASAKVSSAKTEALVSASEKVSSAKTEALINASKAVDPTNTNTLATLSKEIDPSRMQVLSEAISLTKDDKVFAAVFAINSVQPGGLKEAVNLLQLAISAINTIQPDAAIAALTAIGGIDPGPAASAQQILASIRVPTSLSSTLSVYASLSAAKGTIGNFARAKGNVALAGGTTSTLMGELGPELVVSNGRYYIVGQNGAEFVDLASDAIVFNHLQTKRLMQQGAISGRGQAFTNEHEATSFATGNVGPARGVGTNVLGGMFNTAAITTLAMLLAAKMVKNVKFSGSLSPSSFPILTAGATGNVKGGPAQASAKAALAALKQLRAQWKALAGMSAKDLAGLGGSGGGGGGGNKTTDPKVFVKQLEIWYNWLQKIASLEEKINYEEAKRNEISSSFAPSGKAYVQSLKESLDYLKEEAAILLSLVESQQEYFKKRLNELNTNNGPFSQLYEFDDDGQLKYKNGKLEQLSELVGRDQYGNAKMTAEELYKLILAINPELAKWMKTDSSGNKIDKSQDDWYVTAVQAFWDKMDSDKEEMLSLHDSIEEHKLAVLEQEQLMNEILHEIEDNLIEVENKVLNAMVEDRQRKIDELQKERDALEKASTDLINGLSDLLLKERDMYDTAESKSELTSLLRLLAILQRSGGSASLIASLLKDISQRLQDAYFEAQLAEIDALQEASDKQLEKLDQQIDLETELLEYEKLHGMLWQQVYDYMTTHSAADISQYIADKTEAYWGKSETDLAKTVRGDLFASEKYKEVVGGPLGSVQQAAEIYSKEALLKQSEAQREEEARLKAAAEEAARKAAEEAARKKAEEEARKKREEELRKSSSPSTPAPSDDSDTAIVRWGKEYNSTTGQWRYVGYDSRGNPLTRGSWQGGLKAAAGGYVGHGVYELGEQGTETVLTAEQTQVLRNNILSNRPNSLISLLKSYNESYRGIGSAVNNVSQVEDNSMVIEHIEMNMNVSKIADDYDAKRAGEQALQKMVEIARKTQAQNRIGR